MNSSHLNDIEFIKVMAESQSLIKFIYGQWLSHLVCMRFYPKYIVTCAFNTKLLYAEIMPIGSSNKEADIIVINV